jgi:hypothetical protein
MKRKVAMLLAACAAAFAASLVLAAPARADTVIATEYEHDQYGGAAWNVVQTGIFSCDPDFTNDIWVWDLTGNWWNNNVVQSVRQLPRKALGKRRAVW